MNIIKKINIHHLLTLPFIIVPFLVTHRFQDPTLLIKRSGVFFIFLVIIIILLAIKSRRNIISTTNLKYLYGTGAFIFALAVISSFNSINVNESYWELLYLSGWISIYACFMLYSTKETMKYIIVASSVVGAVLSLLLFNDAFHWMSITLPSKGIMSATFGYRNYFGQYLCFALPAAVISLFMLKSNKARLCILICCIFNFCGLILTRTRAAWLGVFISLLIFSILNRRIIIYYIKNILRNKGYLSITAAIFLIVGYFINIPIKTSWHTMDPGKETVWETISTLRILNTEKGWKGRINMYKSTISIIKDYPILGVGLNNWRLINPKYSDNTNTDSQLKNWHYTKIIQRPHNDFLWILSEVGFIGMIFFVIFLIYHLRLLLRVLKRGQNCEEERYLFMFFLISLIAIGIESMFDFPSQRTMPNLYLWSIMGFIATTSTQSIGKERYQKTLPLSLLAVLSIVSVFSYFDIKSNIYSQDAKYYNNNNMPKELYVSSSMALSYYRNLDNAGTPIYYYMGIAKYQLGDKNAAKLFFQRALQLAPFHIGALTNYMILLGELGELTSAHKIMSIIQHVYPRMAKSRLDMAKFYLRVGKNEEAEKILQELKETNLDDGQGTLDKLLLHVGKK